MIKIENICKSYYSRKGSITILKEASAQIFKGAFASIRGPSGCGKSTLLLILGGLLDPDSGSVQIAGQDLQPMTGKRKGLFRAKHIGFVFQQFHLFPYLSVEDNIKAAGLVLPENNDNSHAEELMQQLQIDHRRDHVPGRLSVGEQQRVALGRALYNKPELILADEPTGNLDPENAAIVLETFKQFVKNGGTVLTVTHSPGLAEQADQQWLLSKGNLILEK